MYEFFTDVFKDIANRQILGRLKSHRLKTNHLGILFDREYRSLKQQAFSMIKLYKFKARSQALLTITPAIKEAFVKEYF